MVGDGEGDTLGVVVHGVEDALVGVEAKVIHGGLCCFVDLVEGFAPLLGSLAPRSCGGIYVIMLLSLKCRCVRLDDVG